MSTRLAWGILGTGAIARTFAKAVGTSSTGRVAAVGSRSAESAATFAQAHGIPHPHPSYEALIADREVEAVYISLPHTHHAEWGIRAMEAGKHVLCEKPIGVNHAEAMAMVDTAQAHDVFLMEAFMYRCHPQTAALVDLISRNAIGTVEYINAAFAFACSPGPDHRLVSNALAGGGILDVGCYCTSMSRLIAGAAHGKPFLEPISLSGCAQIGPTRVDEYAIASLRFPGGILAQLSCGVKLRLDHELRIVGSEGTIIVPEPWIPGREGGATTITVQRHDSKEPVVHRINCDRGLYALEADTVAAYVGKRQAPAMSWDDTLGNMRTLDQWRSAIGLAYDCESVDAGRGPLNGRPLSVRKPTSMAYGVISGVSTPVSRLVMGVDNQENMPHAAAMFDDFYNRGGNCFDTAFVYGARKERILGRWMRDRGIRDQVVVISKGAHTPHCNPADLEHQLEQSLEHLGTDHADLYLMHRDNPDIPTGEFVDCLNRLQKAGRIKAFGGSNWSLDRVDQANAWAASHGQTGFAAISNNFSLARLMDPIWAGCISSSDPASRAWLERTRIPILAWSSQARGFFTDRAHPDNREDAELVRCWYSPDNFRRRERVVEIARKRGVQPINIALAYVLCQPFPTFALIGPRLLGETRSSWPALGLELAPDALRYLDLLSDEPPA